RGRRNVATRIFAEYSSVTRRDASNGSKSNQTSSGEEVVPERIRGVGDDYPRRFSGMRTRSAAAAAALTGPAAGVPAVAPRAGGVLRRREGEDRVRLGLLLLREPLHIGFHRESILSV